MRWPLTAGGPRCPPLTGPCAVYATPAPGKREQLFSHSFWGFVFGSLCQGASLADYPLRRAWLQLRAHRSLLWSVMPEAGASGSRGAEAPRRLGLAMQLGVPRGWLKARPHSGV